MNFRGAVTYNKKHYSLDGAFGNIAVYSDCEDYAILVDSEGTVVMTFRAEYTEEGCLNIDWEGDQKIADVHPTESMNEMVSFLVNLTDEDRKKMEYVVIHSDVNPIKSGVIVHCYKDSVEVEEMEYGQTIAVKTKRFSMLGLKAVTKLVEAVRSTKTTTDAKKTLKEEFEASVPYSGGMSPEDYWCEYAEWLEKKINAK